MGATAVTGESDTATENKGQERAAPDTLEERIREWSLYQPWLQNDPTPYWQEMRDHTPLARSEELGGYWILTRYADMVSVAKQPEIFSNTYFSIPPHDPLPQKAIPIQLNGDEHRAWRRALSELFSPAAMRHFSDEITKATADAIDPVIPRGSCEFISEVAVRLPAESFLITFGIERSHLDRVLEYVRWLRANWSKAGNQAEIVAGSRPLWEFLGEMLDLRIAEGTEGRRDVFSRLLEASLDGREITRDEMINAAFTNLFAAFDTTTAALSLTFHHLARNPELQRQVAASSKAAAAATEEGLRLFGVATTATVIAEDTELHGQTLRKGDMVQIPWGLSGLDPQAFDRPEEFDLTRTHNRHIAFGTGPHRCIGAHLARRTIQTALEVWHSKVARYEITPGSEPMHHFGNVRGISRLDLSLEPA